MMGDDGDDDDDDDDDDDGDDGDDGQCWSSCALLARVVPVWTTTVLARVRGWNRAPSMSADRRRSDERRRQLRRQADNGTSRGESGDARGTVRGYVRGGVADADGRGVSSVITCAVRKHFDSSRIKRLTPGTNSYSSRSSKSVAMR